jgi:hypothetical protein
MKMFGGSLLFRIHQHAVPPTFIFWRNKNLKDTGKIVPTHAMKEYTGMEVCSTHF